MKKIRILLLLSFIFLFPLRVLAVNVSPSINCNKTRLEVNESTTCSFYLNVSNGSINAIEASYRYDNSIINVSVSNSGTWQGNASGGVIAYYDDNKTGLVAISNITIVAKQSGSSSFSITVKEVGDENGQAIKPYISTSATINVYEKEVATTTKSTTQATTQKTTKLTTQSNSTNKITTKNNTNKQNSTKKQVTTNKSTSKNTTSSQEINDITSSTTFSIKKTTKNSLTKINKTTKNESKNKIIDNRMLLVIILIVNVVISSIILYLQKIKNNKQEE